MTPEGPALPPDSELPYQADLLDGYLAALTEASRTGRRLSQRDLRRLRDNGARAADLGVSLRELIGSYLSATWGVWSLLPGVRTATGTDALRGTGEVVFRAANAAVVAVTEGYEEAQRWSLRQEESSRREFVDDLLDGRSLGSLAERAERYGLRLTGGHVVAAVRGRAPFVDGGPVTRRVEAALRVRPRSRDVLVTTKDGVLVCVAPDTSGAVTEFVDQVAAVLGRAGSWRAGVGRAQRGPGGAVRSFEQARYALEIGERLRLAHPVHHAADLLVYQVLLRDSAALADLVNAVLEPLRATRTGPSVLLDTLSAYFAAGRIATAAARELHVGVRTVTHRLDRVRALTGYSAYDPQQAFTLHTAVLGAQLLGWPDGSVA